MARPQCDEGDDGLIHKGFAKTSQKGPKLQTPTPQGTHYEIWVCQCGRKTHKVLPGRATQDW